MKIKMRKRYLLTVFKVIVQAISFILIPGLFISVFASLKTIALALISDSFNFIELLPQISIIIAVIPLTILFGRFFCGYLCSFGSMQDLFSFIAKKLFKRKWMLNQKADKALKLIKYVFLLFLIVFVWIIESVNFDASINPWNIFGMYTRFSGWGDLSGFLTVGFFLLIIIISGSVFIDRFFCRYACPLGAVFSIISKLRLVRIKKDENRCGTCQICTNSCPMGISINKIEKVKSSECISCFQCVNACPKQNLKVSITEREIAPLAAGLISTAAMFGIYYAGSLVSNRSYSSISDIQSIELSYKTSIVQGQYTDGIYTGSATGYRGTTTMQVTVNNGFISDVQLISTQDDAQYLNMCQSSVIAEILDSQSTQVSAVTGATYSSNAIINAVANALGISESETMQDITSANESTHTETTNSTEESSVTSASFEDGVYTGSGTGYRGETNVSVTVFGGQIYDIEVLSYVDDRQYFERAINPVIGNIISSQSVDVDAVSGATFSSNGIMEAVADALGLDFTNPNSSLQSGGHFGHGGFKR